MIAATKTETTELAVGHGFRASSDNPEWLDRGHVRIVFGDTDVIVHTFDPDYPKGRILDSTVTLTGAPLGLVTAVIGAAIDTVQAAINSATG